MDDATGCNMMKNVFSFVGIFFSDISPSAAGIASSSVRPLEKVHALNFRRVKDLNTIHNHKYDWQVFAFLVMYMLIQA